MSFFRIAASTGLMSVAMLLVAGCTPATKKSGPTTVKKAHDHDHPEEGPHEGALAEWGANHEYHVEFTVHHKKQEVRVYILGEDAVKPAPIKADKIQLTIKDPMFQMDLTAEPQKGDPAGTSSVFVGKNEKFGIEREFAGTISGEVNGKPYAGDFKEEAHDHKHDKK